MLYLKGTFQITVNRRTRVIDRKHFRKLKLVEDEYFPERSVDIVDNRKNTGEQKDIQLNRLQGSLSKLEEMMVDLTERMEDLAQYVKRNIKAKKSYIKTTVVNEGDQRECKNLHTLILISSNISNIDRRNNIRNTWGKSQNYKIFQDMFRLNYDVFFLVGSITDQSRMSSLQNESKTYRDIVQYSGMEDFYDLSRKVMTGLEWSVTHCTYKFLLKGDDDIYINIISLMKFLIHPDMPQNHLYTGNVVTGSVPFRDRSDTTNGKYAVSMEEYPDDDYPPYCSGGGFILSKDVVNRIIPRFNWRNPLKIDDVYIGILVSKVGLAPITVNLRPELFQLYQSTNSCIFNAGTLLYHKVLNLNCLKYFEKLALGMSMRQVSQFMIMNTGPKTLHIPVNGG